MGMRSIIIHLIFIFPAILFAGEEVDLFDDTSCYSACPATPTGTPASDFFNKPIFLKPENCRALQGFCHWVEKTSPLAVKPVIVTDYNGTQASEKITMYSGDKSISARPRSENSVVFGVIAPKLKNLGYDIGMKTGNLPKEYVASYLAARDDNCEMGVFLSPQAKFDYCLSGRLAGMDVQQLRALYRVMFRVFPSLKTYFTTTEAMLDYLVALGYPLWSQTDGAPYSMIEKSVIHPTSFNHIFSDLVCDFTAHDSDAMNQSCPIVYDAPKISSHEVTIVMNTENVCDGVSYATMQSSKELALCIDDAKGKVSGIQTIVQKTKNAVLLFQGNSDGDFYPGLYVAKQDGIVFIHNNPAVCDAINKEVPHSCFVISDPDNEVTKTVTFPDDEVFAIAARAEGMAVQSYHS